MNDVLLTWSEMQDTKKKITKQDRLPDYSWRDIYWSEIGLKYVDNTFFTWRFKIIDKNKLIFAIIKYNLKLFYEL